MIVDYDCQGCGACCWAAGGTEGYVPLTADEVVRLQRHRLPILGGPSGATAGPYLGTRATATGRRVCVALAGEPGRRCACTVYADRPEACRRYEVGGELCRAARGFLGIVEGD